MRDKITNPDLWELTRHIPARLIEKAPQGKFGDYVPHFVIGQAIMSVCGPFDWELVEILRGDVPEMTTKDGETWPALEGVIVGAVYRMRVEIDGRQVTIEETGSCESPAFEINDGERLKKAASDALKRCGLRIGSGAHLWCKRPDQFFIHRILSGDEQSTDDQPVVGVEEQNGD